MPSSVGAVLAFIAFVLPGFLMLRAYNRERPSTELTSGLVGAGRAVTWSAVIALISWPLGGHDLYDRARAGTALTTHAGATYRFILAILVLAPVAGFIAGEIVDWSTKGAGRLSSRLGRSNSRTARLARRITDMLIRRLVLSGPTTWDRVWATIRGSQPLVYVRITTKGGREVVGTVARESRIAASPQPRDLYLEQVLRQASEDDPRFFPTRFGLGIFVQGSEIESIEFLTAEAVFRAESEKA